VFHFQLAVVVVVDAVAVVLENHYCSQWALNPHFPPDGKNQNLV